MVLICSNNIFPYEKEYSKYFTEFSFELSIFQKWSIKAIVDGNHSLITAHTGSGKTLPIEFAIKYFTKLKKKVIYASPLKALSNQKLYDFRRKFPEISFGILTGDIKDNPDADVIIMTTEILRNSLFIKQNNKEQNKNNMSFNIDLENELAFVCFDEIHFISDSERGTIWEQTIIMLPKHIQLLMLSATIDKPELFAEWIEKQTLKNVLLSSTSKRVVPLNHYLWITMQNKQIKITEKHKLNYNNIINKKIEFLNNNNQFNELNYNKIVEIKKYLEKNKIFISRQFVLNSIVKHLYDNNLLPAICFVLSRKQVEIFANEIEINLINSEDNNYNIEYECSKILYSKFDSKIIKDIVILPEYISTINLLKKGIAVHHAGIIPIIRELIEILFEKNYIKLVFATETFAVGINMPTKTVIFTSLIKYDGNHSRYLYPHEYKQMAGRAGRRGIDQYGYVIHCNNLFNAISPNETKHITNGPPQQLSSKFKISFSLVLNILIKNKNNGINELNKFIQHSMMNVDIINQANHVKTQIETLENILEDKNKNIPLYIHSEIIIEEYYKLKKIYNETKNKNIKQKYYNNIENLENLYHNIKNDFKIYEEINTIKQELVKLKIEYKNINNYINDNINILLNILNENDFINYNIKVNYIDNENIVNDNNIEIKNKGIIASNIQEIHSLALADLYNYTNGFKEFNTEEITAILSCFTNININNDNATDKPNSKNTKINDTCLLLKKYYNYYYDLEVDYNINTGLDYNIQFYIIDEIIEWCKAENENECIIIIQKIKNYNISLGDFIKAILKINNIANEIEQICENIGNIELLYKIKKIPYVTMKYVVNNISLYV